MVHLLLAYELLLTILGVLTLVLLSIGRKSRNWFPSFLGFYSVFFLIFLLAFIRAYLLVNIDETSSYFIYMSHGITTILNYLLLIFGIFTLHRIAFQVFPKRERIFTLILILSGLLMISPLSLVYIEETASIQLKFFNYLSTLPYMACLGYLSWGFFNASRSLTDRKDKMISLLLAILSLSGFTETLLSFLGDIRNPVYSIDSPSGSLILSSIPYALLSVFVIIMIIEHLTSAKRVPDQEGLKELGYSKRESEVILLILRGDSNETIADELCISRATVKTHINNIFRKSQVKNRFELARKLENTHFPPKG